MTSRISEVIIAIKPPSGDFAEDKDEAAAFRETQVRPALATGKRVVFDFTGVRVATQSFVHALISDILRKQGEAVLDQITFKKCTKAVKGIIETVVQYSLESLETEREDERSPVGGSLERGAPAASHGGRVVKEKTRRRK